MSDLFESDAAGTGGTGYSAADIEVLEGLEPVRRRPGMYIGGTDDRALHHLAAEILDNSMDEAVAGHATRIEVGLTADNTLMIRDNGRGIPVDPHPKYKDKSALEVVMTTLHAGGKFNGKVYATSGGLHGVGISVVNALSDRMVIEVARDRKLWAQDYSRGRPQGPLVLKGAAPNRRGTTVWFHPDAEIFGDLRFKPATLYRLGRSKAYLHRGVEIRWACDPALLAADGEVPAEETLHFPGGLADFMATLVDGPTVTPEAFTGLVESEGQSKIDWAITWPLEGQGFTSWYCNTVPTPLGGTHELGLRSALTKALRSFAELSQKQARAAKRAQQITADDILGGAVVLLSVFIPDPQFQGQTKDRLTSPQASRLVENAIRDRFEHWLTANPAAASDLLAFVLDRAEERLRRKEEKTVGRKTATRRLRLPGKLADCTRDEADGTELFLVEGDSAGGSAKQARNRDTQAVLALRGKILNVASASLDKLKGNQEINDIILALGSGTGRDFKLADLRYERIVIMTDADVDGAHIASLLMTFFFRQMPGLIDSGRLYLAVPPLYRVARGGDTAYARDDADLKHLLATRFKGAKTEISRFKGLGEMPARQLKETTMAPETRTLLRVGIDQGSRMLVAERVETLMGKRPEKRFQFIQENARFVTEALDV